MKERKRSGCLILLVILAAHIALGIVIGRLTAPIKTETVTVYETVQVPVYQERELPEVTERYMYPIPLSHSLQNYLYEICADEGLPVSLILAMIETESSFNPEVISKTNDYGLMQLNKINHEWLNEQYRAADMLNPYQNVFCGVKIISSFVKRYGDYGKALMAYNMGDYGAKKAWENGIASTKYSEKIIALMKKYEEVANEQ